MKQYGTLTNLTVGGPQEKTCETLEASGHCD